jgi:hypothetical protein
MGKDGETVVAQRNIYFLDFLQVLALSLYNPLHEVGVATAEGIEARPLFGHLSRVEPLVNPIR